MQYKIHSSLLIINSPAQVELASILVANGYDNFHQANYDDAIEFANKNHPQLILLFPAPSKDETLQIIQQLRQSNNEIVILLCCEILEDKAELFRAGINDYIGLPIVAEELFIKIETHLERKFFKLQMQKELFRMQDEIADARSLQNLILPTKDLLANIRKEKAIDCGYIYSPAYELGGDYVSIRRLENGKIALIMADVVGHGLGSALYAFSLHTMLSDNVLQTKDLSDVLGFLNNKLRHMIMLGKFATIFIGIIDIENNVMEYAAAAHTAPILLTSNTAISLDASGFPIGAIDNAAYETRSISIKRGDAIFLYSDALIETEDLQEQYLQEDEIMQMLKENAGKSSDDMLRLINRQYTQRFSINKRDDLSMIYCQI